MSGTSSTTRSPIDPRTKVGAVSLTVADLNRSLTYYRDAIGLDVLEVAADRASLGAGGTEIVQLVAAPGAVPSRGHTGLFHLALLVPERSDLARWLAHAARDEVPLAGMSDHFVSEAIYLQDPDDHGIEIYSDRPRALWEKRVSEMTTVALDVADLLSELENPAIELFEGLPPGTSMGHVHLRVADIPSSIGFYRDLLGFDLMATYGPHAAFLSAGGYHHHIGVNVWQSMGGEPPPPGTAALRLASIIVPSSADVDAIAGRVDAAGQEPGLHPCGVTVRDPSGTTLLVTAGTPAFI